MNQPVILVFRTQTTIATFIFCLLVGKSLGEEANPVQPPYSGIVLCLPEVNADQLPGNEFFAPVNLAASTYTQPEKAPDIYILGTNQMAVTYARIVLHSYSITEDKIKLLKELSSIELPKTGVLGLAGKPADSEAAYLEKNKEKVKLMPMPLPKPFIRSVSGARHPRIETCLIVLGNEPLDSMTPSIDMVKRVSKATDFIRANPGTFVVFTGGTTVGEVSEARMMALIAISRSPDIGLYALEEKAKTTRENAAFCASIVKPFDVKHVYIVSKQSHLTWALPMFHKHEIFGSAEGMDCGVTDSEIKDDFLNYLKSHENPRIRQRLENVSKGVMGAD